LVLITASVVRVFAPSNGIRLSLSLASSPVPKDDDEVTVAALSSRPPTELQLARQLKLSVLVVDARDVMIMAIEPQGGRGKDGGGSDRVVDRADAAPRGASKRRHPIGELKHALGGRAGTWPDERS
jgi:hypothetical protein